MDEAYSKKMNELEDNYMVKKVELQKLKVKVWKEKALNRMENDKEWTSRRKRRQHEFAKRQQKL